MRPYPCFCLPRTVDCSLAELCMLSRVLSLLGRVLSKPMSRNSSGVYHSGAFFWTPKVAELMTRSPAITAFACISCDPRRDSVARA